MIRLVLQGEVVIRLIRLLWVRQLDCFMQPLRVISSTLEEHLSADVALDCCKHLWLI
jgi:hypothetical protein